MSNIPKRSYCSDVRISQSTLIAMNTATERHWRGRVKQEEAVTQLGSDTDSEGQGTAREIDFLKLLIGLLLYSIQDQVRRWRGQVD